jgi:hypothetical protein
MHKVEKLRNISYSSRSILRSYIILLQPVILGLVCVYNAFTDSSRFGFGFEISLGLVSLILS